MNTYRLKISSPDGDLFDEEIVKLSLRGSEGDLAVMAGHIPFVTAVKSCDCKIELADGSIKTAHTDGGILTVSSEKVVLLSGSFVWNDN